MKAHNLKTSKVNFFLLNSRQPLIFLTLQIIFTNKCFLFILCAAFFRFLGGYSLGFWGANFFTKAYPDQQSLYAVMNAFVTIAGGMPSSFIGGYLGDRYEKRFGQAKAYISGIGALSSCVFIVICFMIQVNFWVSMTAYYFAYLTAEVWYGITFSMINQIFPS